MTSPGPSLASVPLFAGLTPTEREAVAARGAMCDAPPDTLLIREGEKADAMFALLSGTARVFRRDAGGRDVLIATLGPGDCFGEMALLDGDQRSATIITGENCRYFVLHRDDFWDLIAPSPELLRKLLAELSLKVRDTSGRLARAELEARVSSAENEVQRHRTIAHAVTGLAHEINTPLGICVSMASFLKDRMRTGTGTLDPALHEPVRIIGDNLGRVVSLVQTFHALAADQQVREPVPMDLREAIEEALWLFDGEHPDHRLSVTIDGGPFPWLGHRAPFQRTLSELLANAAVHAYADAGGPVEIGLEPAKLRGEPAYRLSVRDRGAGVPEEHRARLVDAFFTTARSRGHKGLGLTIAYNMVTGPIGGTLALEFEPGPGTTAVLVIPQTVKVPVTPP